MKISSLVLNSVDFDSRVQKTAKTLSSYGDVTVFGLRDAPDQPVYLQKDGYAVERRIHYRKPLRNGITKRAAQAWAYSRFFVHSALALRSSAVAVCNDVGTLPPALAAKLLNPSLRIIYDSHEYQAHTHWVGPHQRALIQRLEKFALKRVSATVVVSPAIAQCYQNDYGIPLPTVVMNCPPSVRAEATGKLRAKVGAGMEEQIVLFQGGLTAGRGLEEALEGFIQTRDPLLRLVFMGFGPLEPLIREYSAKDPRIALVPAVAPSEVLSHTVDANFGLCMLVDTCLNHRYALPNKVFEYLAVGVPVLINSLSELNGLVERHDAGMVMSSLEPDQIARAFEGVRSFDRRAFERALPHTKAVLCWEEQEKGWIAIMDRLGFARRADG